MAEIIWSKYALNDLRQIYDYISLDSKVYAKSVIDGIYSKIDVLKLFPKSGKEITISNRNVREVLSPPFRIIYILEELNVKILTIVHMKRNF